MYYTSNGPDKISLFSLLSHDKMRCSCTVLFELFIYLTSNCGLTAPVDTLVSVLLDKAIASTAVYVVVSESDTEGRVGGQRISHVTGKR